MLVKKLLLSLCAAGVVGGTGTGIYYSLKEVDSEKTQEITAVPDVNNDVHGPVSVALNGGSGSPSTLGGTNLVQKSDTSTEGGLVTPDVNPTGSEGEESDEQEVIKTVTSEDSNVVVQPEGDSNSESQGSPGTSEEAQQAAADQQAEEARQAAEKAKAIAAA